MQGNISQALALTAVGNAALNGRDVTGFWPDASVFVFSKLCEFREPDGSEEMRLVAADPLDWFEMLRTTCSGLRLHAAPMEQQPGLGPIAERMLVGFVGGGPRWLIEAVGRGRSRIWQGFDHVLDRNDAERRIWAHTYLLQGETAPQSLSITSVQQASVDLDAALAAIEGLSREIGAEHFTERFVQAGAALAEGGPPAFHVDIADYADLDEPARRLFAAATHAWVFGGMGSWNDMGGFEPELNARYERCSEELFDALVNAVSAIANSTYRGS